MPSGKKKKKKKKRKNHNGKNMSEGTLKAILGSILTLN